MALHVVMCRNSVMRSRILNGGFTRCRHDDGYLLNETRKKPTTGTRHAPTFFDIPRPWGGVGVCMDYSRGAKRWAPN